MAIFVCNFKVITRGEGRSAVAAAAYRSGERIMNQWDGVEHDYSNKQGVAYKNILLPEHAPVKYQDRATLWNAVELAEKASDSRLCRECMVALPVELSRQQQIALVEEYVQRNFVDHGMCADIAIHDPVLRDDLHRPIDQEGNPTSDPTKFQYNNPHAHILLTMRPIDQNGRWEAKTQKEYICKKGGEEGKFTAAEFKAAQRQGWQKQYRYTMQDGSRAWLTPSEAEAEGLGMNDRTSRSPRSTTYGRKNPTCEYWSDRRRVPEWRQSWAELTNRKLEAAHIDASIDARSYEEQGIDRIPGVHLGTQGNLLEKRAQRLERMGESTAAARDRSENGRLNEEIKRYNQAADKYHHAEQAAERKIQQIAYTLENLRARHLCSGYTASSFRQTLATLQKISSQKETDIQDSLALLEAMMAMNEKSVQVIAALTAELTQLPVWRREKKQALKNQIQQEQQKIDDRNKYIISEWQRRGFQDESELRFEVEQQKQRIQSLNKQLDQVKNFEREAEVAATEHETLTRSIPAIYREKMDEKLLQIKPQTENEILRRLQQEFKDDFSHTDYARYRQADRKAGSGDRSRDTQRRQPLSTKKHSHGKRKPR